MESVKKLEEKFLMNQRKNEEPNMKSSIEVINFIVIYCLKFIAIGEVDDQVLYKHEQELGMTFVKKKKLGQGESGVR